MRAICTPLGIGVEERWGKGFIVTAGSEVTIFDRLTKSGFNVKGIGIGYDYNRHLVSLYAEPVEV